MTAFVILSVGDEWIDQVVAWSVWIVAGLIALAHATWRK